MVIIFFTYALFASAIFVNKLALTILPPTLFVGLRMSIAGSLLLIYTLYYHYKAFYNLREDWLKITLISLFTTFLPSLLKAYALSHLSAPHATLFGSIDPFVTALYAYLLWGDKLSISNIMGIILGMLGLMISLDLYQVSTGIITTKLLPQLAALAAPLLSRWGWILVRTIMQTNRYPATTLNGLIMIESGLLALVSALFQQQQQLVTITSWPYFLFLMGYTIIVGNIISYLFYFHLIKQFNLTLVSLAGFSITLYVSFYSWLFQGQILPCSFWLSAGLFFSGLLVFYYDELKKQRLLT